MVEARANDLAVAPRKVAEVVALIRGRTVADALVILEHTPRKSAKPIQKLVTSAQANAVNNHNLKEEGLIIQEITVGPGVRYRRYRPASRGRALPYVRQRSNVLIRIDGEEAKKPASSTSAKAASSKQKTTKSGIKVESETVASAKKKPVKKKNDKKEKK